MDETRNDYRDTPGFDLTEEASNNMKHIGNHLLGGKSVLLNIISIKDENGSRADLTPPGIFSKSIENSIESTN